LAAVAIAGLSAAPAVGAKKAKKPSGARPSSSSKPFGLGTTLWTLNSGHGMVVRITNYGAVVQSIVVRDRHNRKVNVALGFPRAGDYISDFTQGATGNPWPLPGGSGDTFFGAIIGRYANRIANGSFTMKCIACANNGLTYTMDKNNGSNTLHGGYLGWNTATWTGSLSHSANAVTLSLTHAFPAGEGCLKVTASCTGFPAPVTATVVYSLTRANALDIRYRVDNTAPPGGDATVVNLTNHTYFNLGGESSGTVYDQLLRINANRFQPVNVNLIPIGFAKVKGTPFDFRKLKPIGRDIRKPSGTYGQPAPQLVITHGYDHNWVLNGSGYRLAAVAEDRANGIVLKAFTDEPGVQLYTGNFLVGDLTGTGGRTYRQSDAFTLETQHFPDTPHHIGEAGWPPVVLGPDSTFQSRTTYSFSTLR
jgi:aldose 1-epimerase